MPYLYTCQWQMQVSFDALALILSLNPANKIVSK